ncbi:MAG: pentapeptide repeat-containing protein, partial [Phormidesmis priestleyi]
TQFRWANLHQTVMIRCDAEGANFSGASLHRTDLRLSNLRSASFAGANLRGAKLCYSDLSGADLTGADLTGADLTGANLTGAHIEAVCWRSTTLQRAQVDASWALKAADKSSRLVQPLPLTPV